MTRPRIGPDDPHRVTVTGKRNQAARDPAVVYVVDDNDSVRKSLARLIGSVGLDVETFSSASAFMERRLPGRPGCLVLDVRLSGSSGLDLQSTLGEAQRDLPIIFLTGYGDVPTTVRAMKGGALDFLQKPYNDQDLLDAIQRALVQSREALAETAERKEIQHRVDSLTSREREVLMLVVTGMLNKQIAAELGAAEKTIKVHRGRMMKKMQANSVAELVRTAEKVGVRAL